MQLLDKVVVITGGCQGIGLATGRYLAGKGMQIALVDLDADKLASAAQSILQAGGRAHTYRCNVANEDEVGAMAAAVAADFGGVDALINNAGILRDGLTLKVRDGELCRMTLAQWQAVLDVNLTGVFLCTREIAAQMIAHKNPGVIVNISSIARAGNMGQANYSAAKAGVAADTVVWAKELAPHGIRVAAVAPGFIETEMVASMRPEMLQKICSAIPLQRMGQPAEIAHSIGYILENDYFTGRILELDGGLRL